MFNFIDFRNAVYQGQMQDGKPHGIGVLIDNKLLFLLAEFKDGEVDGAVFAVYPDCKVFCGHIRNRALTGLCCFYLKDKMQVYMNYSQQATKQGDLIAVLPFCRVILEVDNQQQEHPKVKRYENYGGKGQQLNQLLQNLFGSYQELDQYSSWEDFLLINFIQPFQKKLYWKTVSEEKYTEFFLGIRSSGLGIKMIVFFDEEYANNVQGSPLLVSSIGYFQNGETLKGYGQRLIDYQMFNKVQEGVFYQNEKETYQYFRTNRPGNVKNFYQKNQLKSVNFENFFFNFSLIYQLEKLYAKLNVSLVQETHKIALVTINRPNNSPIELAEIEKKQRKRTQTPPKTKYSPIKVPSSQATSTHHQQSTYLQAKSITHQPKYIQPLIHSGSMTQAKKSIYGSVQKIKKINPETRLNAIKNLQKMFDGNKNRDFSDSLQRKPQKESQKPRASYNIQKPLLNPSQSNNFDRFINNSIKQAPSLQKLEKNRYKYRDNQVDELVRGNKKQKHFTPTKPQTLLDRLHGISPNSNISPDTTYYPRVTDNTFQTFKPLTRNKTDLPLLLKDTEYQRKPSHQKKISAERPQKYHYSRQNQPYYKTVLEEDVYSKYHYRINQKQEQLKYFNNMFGSIGRHSPELAKQNERAVSPSPLKNKTPGKIKIINRRKDNQIGY